MRRVITLLSVSLLFIPTCLFAEETELEVAVKQIPSRVLKAATDKMEGFQPEEAEIEAKLIYEIKGEWNEKEIELELTAEGEIFKTEIDEAQDNEQDASCVEQENDSEADAEDEETDEENELQITLQALPKSILKAVRKEYPDIEIEQVSVESVLVFTIEGDAGDQEYEIEVTAEGDVIEVEQVTE